MQTLSNGCGWESGCPLVLRIKGVYSGRILTAPDDGGIIGVGGKEGVAALSVIGIEPSSHLPCREILDYIINKAVKSAMFETPHLNATVKEW